MTQSKNLNPYKQALLAQLTANKQYKRRQLINNQKYYVLQAQNFLNSSIANLNVSPHQKQGYEAQQTAIKFLRNQGLKLLYENLFYKTGELDLVMQHNDTLIFIEVRARNSQSYGGSAASINSDKKLRLYRTAQYFLPYISRVHFDNQTPLCRFDVVAIQAQSINWIKHALTF